jgi:hypothetical protein
LVLFYNAKLYILIFDKIGDLPFFLKEEFMSKSGSGFSLGTILFIGFVIFNLFDDDDEDKKDVESKKSSEVAIEKTSDISLEDVKKEAAELLSAAKKAFIEVKDEYVKQSDEDPRKDELPPPEVEKPKPDEIIIKSDDKEEIITSLNKDENEIPSLSISTQDKPDQPTFRTIE